MPRYDRTQTHPRPLMPVTAKDPRKPDEMVHFFRAGEAVRPRQTDYSMWGPMRFDQFNIKMCVGVGVLTAVANDLARQGIIPTGLPLYLSPWHLYNAARKKEGTLASDCGCFPEDAVDQVVDNGVVAYTDWPKKYDKDGYIIFDSTDPDTFSAKLIKFPGAVKARIDNGVKGLNDAMGRGPVAIAVPWFENWDASYCSGVLPPPKGDPTGRHLVPFDGDDLDRGIFAGPNSWDIWGIKETITGERPAPCGFFMPFEYIELFKRKGWGYDAFNIDIPNMSPFPEMKLPLTIHGYEGAYGGGVFNPGGRVTIYAGKKAGCEFSSWYPQKFCDNPWSAETTVTMTDVIDLRAYYYEKKQQKRCKLFDLAALKNKQEGIQ